MECWSVSALSGNLSIMFEGMQSPRHKGMASLIAKVCFPLNFEFGALNLGLNSLSMTPHSHQQYTRSYKPVHPKQGKQQGWRFLQVGRHGSKGFGL